MGHGELAANPGEPSWRQQGRSDAGRDRAEKSGALPESGRDAARAGMARGSRRRWPVTVERGPVRLRPLRRRDETQWNQIRRSNMTWLSPWEATLPPGAERGPATWRAMLSALRRQAREGRMLPWAICYRSGADQDHRLVGQLTVSGIVGGSAAWGQIGYWVDQQWAGRGIVPTAVAMAVDHCFGVLGLHRIEIAIRPENVKSLRVVEKLGIRSEGIRLRYLHIDHDWRDHLIFALTPEEVPKGLLARWEGQRGDAGQH